MLDYPNDRRDTRCKSHVGNRPEEDAQFDSSSTVVRRSWFGRFLARKSPKKT